MTASPDAARTRRDAALWACVLAGPVAWMLDLGLSYLLVGHAQKSGHKLSLYLVTGLAALITALGAWRAWRAWSEVRESPPAPEGRVRGRARFMALSGVVLCAFFLLVIVADAIPKIIHTPGD